MIFMLDPFTSCENSFVSFQVTKESSTFNRRDKSPNANNLKENRKVFCVHAPKLTPWEWMVHESLS